MRPRAERAPATNRWPPDGFGTAAGMPGSTGLRPGIGAPGMGLGRPVHQKIASCAKARVGKSASRPPGKGRIAAGTAPGPDPLAVGRPTLIALQSQKVCDRPPGNRNGSTTDRPAMRKPFMYCKAASADSGCTNSKKQNPFDLPVAESCFVEEEKPFGNGHARLTDPLYGARFNGTKGKKGTLHVLFCQIEVKGADINARRNLRCCSLGKLFLQLCESLQLI